MESIIQYKKTIASRFIPIEGVNAVNDIPEADEYIFSEKIDGHIAFAVVGDEVKFYNRSANLLDLPHLVEAFPKDKKGIWAGELYLKKERSRSFSVASALANAKSDLHFAVFDAVHELDKQSDDRTKIVQEQIPVGNLIHPVKWMKSTSRKELVQKYNEAIEANQEGLVVHTTLGYTYKLKPSVQLDLTVIGYSIKEDGSGIRALLVGLLDENKWIVVGSVGGGFVTDDRSDWLNRLETIECEADIVVVANNRLAYKWVKPSIVIQVKCIEILNEDSSGPISKESLTYVEGSGYQSEGKRSAVSLISPVFMGIRADKVPGNPDTSISQITDRVEILGTKTSEQAALQDSEILFREAYYKESKSGVAVRKFVGIKTNKLLKDNYPPFLLYFTDFSAGRKDPLQTDIKIASSEEKLKLILESEIEKNVKKGWEKWGS
ncbi:MAG: hypothetical protein WAT92_18655 [Saprospiraceae bacterium]|nr:hypothetical protein [Saprospiraceae bacterium]